MNFLKYDMNVFNAQKTNFCIYLEYLLINYRFILEIRSRIYDSGLVYYKEFYIKKSKIFIDIIDKGFTKHYCFTNEELDCTYNIKIRMSSELEEEN